MRKLFLAAVLALFTSSVFAQAPGVIELPLVSDYDLDSTSYVYCVTTTQDGNVFGPLFTTPGAKVTTSGSSTTITGTTGQNAFANSAVGDELELTYNGISVWRYIVTATSADSVVVNTAVNFASPGAAVRRRKRACGTAATDGWFPVRNTNGGILQYSIDQLNVTGGIDVKFECRLPGSVPTATTVSPVVNKTAVSAVSIVWDQTFLYQECRLGFKIGSADDGGDLTTNLEKISAFVVERR